MLWHRWWRQQVPLLDGTEVLAIYMKLEHVEPLIWEDKNIFSWVPMPGVLGEPVDPVAQDVIRGHGLIWILQSPGTVPEILTYGTAIGGILAPSNTSGVRTAVIMGTALRVNLVLALNTLLHPIGIERSLH